MIRLSPEEIDKLWTSYDRKTYEVDAILRNVAKAQLKKVYEWGNEPCPHTHDILLDISFKRQCDECWQALLEEIK